MCHGLTVDYGVDKICGRVHGVVNMGGSDITLFLFLEIGDELGMGIGTRGESRF